MTVGVGGGGGESSAVSVSVLDGDWEATPLCMAARAFEPAHIVLQAWRMFSRA